MSIADFKVEHHGTIALVTPMNECASAWWRKHVVSPSWARFGEAYAVEPRFVQPILDGAEAEAACKSCGQSINGTVKENRNEG